jgi:hypothetical protein
MIRSFLSRVIAAVRGADTTGEQAVIAAREAAELSAQLEVATPQRRPQLFNRLGDALTRSGDRQAALEAYGHGIDGYLENGYFDAAGALCGKVIGSHPEVVRARCTLAFLLLGKELFADAEQQIRGYVAAARSRGSQAAAVARLHQMAVATESLEIRALLAEMLQELGDAQGADQVMSRPIHRQDPVLAPPMDEQRERWSRLLRVHINAVPSAASSGRNGSEPASPA